MTQREFLDNTVAHYTSKNRCVNEDGLCVYASTSTSEGCAIGRWMNPEIAKEIDKGAATVDINIREVIKEYPGCLPEFMNRYSVDFLMAVQRLHDDCEYWDERGLSQSGQREYNTIIRDFNLY